MKRYITLSDGTSMGDSVHVFETDAPAEELKTLEKASNEVYINGGSFEDVPIWAYALAEKGYVFEYVDSCQHITPYGTSSDWLERKYSFIKEHYKIENQPNIN